MTTIADLKEKVSKGIELEFQRLREGYGDRDLREKSIEISRAQLSILDEVEKMIKEFIRKYQAEGSEWDKYYIKTKEIKQSLLGETEFKSCDVE